MRTQSGRTSPAPTLNVTLERLRFAVLTPAILFGATLVGTVLLGAPAHGVWQDAGSRGKEVTAPMAKDSRRSSAARQEGKLPPISQPAVSQPRPQGPTQGPTQGPSQGPTQRPAPTPAPQAPTARQPVKPQAPTPAPQAPTARQPAKPQAVVPVPQKPIPQRKPLGKPEDVLPAPTRKPVDSEPIARKPVGSRPVDAKPVSPRPVVQKPNDPRAPVDRPGSTSKPSAPSKPSPTKPEPPRRPIIDDDAPIAPTVRTPSKPMDRPVDRPVNRPTPKPIDPPITRRPDTIKPVGSSRAPGSEGNATVKPRPEPPITRGSGTITRDISTSADADATSVLSRRPNQFVANEVFGVPLSPQTGGPSFGPGAGSTGSGSNNTVVVNSNNTVIYNDNRTYTQYVNNVSRCNGWGFGSSWSSCGPCDIWQPYDCSDGLSISVGFGNGGFSFGFFYGSSCAPLCSSWSNPWWDGYATSWTCAPTYSWGPTPWRSPYWQPYASCWNNCWNPCVPWWSAYYSCGPCPIPAYTPCFAYSPILCSSVVYAAPVVVAAPVLMVAAPVVVPAPQPLPNPTALWTFLAEGYDTEAENGFAALAAVDPGESSWLIGKGFARAFRGETSWASDMLRTAFLTDASGVTRTSGDGRYLARLDALERSLSPLANASPPSVDALLVIAASQAARGDLSAAFFTATTAQAEGDRTAGTAAFIGWLQSELRRRI